MKMYNDLFVWHRGYDDISISHQTTMCNSLIDYFCKHQFSMAVLQQIMQTLNANCGTRFDRVKSGKFGHQVNSDTHLQTVEIQMRRLLMSRLIRIFTVCFVNLFFIPMTEL